MSFSVSLAKAAAHHRRARRERHPGGTGWRPSLRANTRLGPGRRTGVLSARERQIIELLADGLTGDEVAGRLMLSAETVKTHIRNAMTKLEARNRVHAIAIALRTGLISFDGDRVVTR